MARNMNDMHDVACATAMPRQQCQRATQDTHARGDISSTVGAIDAWRCAWQRGKPHGDARTSKLEQASI
eukprot:6169607-Alexandrium_andersonii.AAC.1